MNRTYNQLNVFEQSIVDDYLDRFSGPFSSDFENLHFTREEAIEKYIQPDYDADVHGHPDYNEERHKCVRWPMNTFVIEVNDEFFVDADGSMADGFFAGYDWPECVTPKELKWDMWKVVEK